ncbi:GAF and ANTAR domain-containing protein [Paractinoplanes toevensis]|uniref:ANTAR domain-containing protein n=1 Tax=Paractinoplanes toevensis TaxID=571911 RepID=A0A919WD80_9ACTN|nr:GAF and ANTAR domain-containing protein [Actinoplanes toevensis]GIM98074.1 hypothetical protein Ato02nite_098670 [Actinoplanes toevensis]
MTDDYPLEPSVAFAELGRIKLAETDLTGVLEQVSGLAKRAVPGAAEVSVTLVRGQGAYTPAFTGDLALALDEFQYEQGHGPCLDASASMDTLTLSDMSTEPRWPQWASRALAQGVHSSLAVGLPVHEAVSGALNIYATKPQAFDEDAIVIAQTFAGYAAVALANAHVYDAAATLSQNLQAAMVSRAVIEQAKGIIMADQHCSADEAFRILTRLSQNTNRKVREVAAAVVARSQEPSKR